MLRAIRLLGMLTLCVLGLALSAQESITLPNEIYTKPGPHVVVNGVRLDAPLISKQGSLLLPMRAVFEALQSDVRWVGPVRQIIATRGSTIVTLWIDNKMALINEKEVALAVAPTMINGVTYVPLRFPAEAFGGDVKWLSNVQTALITITPPATVVVPPTTAPAPTANQLTGLLISKVTTPVTALVVKQTDDADPLLVQLTKDAAITRGQTTKEMPKADFANLEIGDQLTITRDAQLRAVQVAALYMRVSGAIVGVAKNRILLDNGTLYEMLDNSTVVDTAGKTLAIADLKTGLQATLHLVPNTASVWKVIIPAPAPVAAAPLTAPATAPATTTTTTKTFAITAPLDKSKFGATVTVQGTATPSAKINVSIEYRKMTAGLFAVNGAFYRNTLVADATGKWTTAELKTSLPLVGNLDALTITAELLDSTGKAVQKIEYSLTRE